MMQQSNENSLIKVFTENYVEKLFYFCLKKTGNNEEAEDLAQDISVNIITALNKGTIPVNFHAWVWQIARNRYSKWADVKHKRNELISGFDIEDLEIADLNSHITDDIIHEEQLSLLRRELSFVKSEYRNIVVSYCIENKSVREIASFLSLTVSTVQQRLHRARIILKEGMDMAREFGKRSYNPENITFVKDGINGDYGQPWSIISRLLYKNIFLETYENPQTAEELALELGISLPYMEDDLEFLVREQLLRKEGNKYQTDFKIVSREDQRIVYEKQKRVQKPITDKLCELVDLYMKTDGAKVNIENVGYESAKWTLLGIVYDKLYDIAYHSFKGCCNKQRPARPDNGSWILTGYETFDWTYPDHFGLHTAQEDDKGNTVCFGQYRLPNNYDKLPEFLSYNEAYNLFLVCSGKIDECEASYIDKLIDYGYVTRIGNDFNANIVIIKKDAEYKDNENISKLCNEIIELLEQSFDPYNTSMIYRNLIYDQAINDKWLLWDDHTLLTAGAYIYI